MPLGEDSCPQYSNEETTAGGPRKAPKWHRLLLQQMKAITNELLGILVKKETPVIFSIFLFSSSLIFNETAGSHAEKLIEVHLSIQKSL